jgi:hypothetical protein
MSQDMLSIAVRYSQAGWTVVADGLEQPQVFASGAKAEAAAHAYARQVAAAGGDAVVKIFARDGRLAGARPYAASLVA